MLHSCTHMVTVGVKGLNVTSPVVNCYTTTSWQQTATEPTFNQ